MQGTTSVSLTGDVEEFQTLSVMNVTSFLLAHVTSQNPDHQMTVSKVFTPSEYFVSTRVQKIAEIAMDFCLSLIISLSGVVSNTLVIIVFAKQGYKDSMNISMTAIAIWDLAKCLGGAMQRMAGPVQLINRADAESWANVCVVAFNYLICFSSYVSSVLAAFVAFERCLCVSMPFKVKGIFTPKVTFIACLVISIVVFGSFAIIWGIYDIVWIHHPGYNRSIFVYRYNDFFHDHKGPLFSYYNLSGIIWPLASFVVISLCTVIIVVQLQRSSKFRASAIDDSDRNGEVRLSQRDRQVVKMLLMIIIVYIINLSPRIALYMAKYFIYDFYFLRLYHNLFTVVCYVLFFFDILNAAVNLYIFLVMSSKFRSTFVALFLCYGTSAMEKTTVSSTSVMNK